MIYISSIIGFIGFVLFLIGYFNKTKSWSKTLLTIGFIFMALHIVHDVVLGAYDGWVGNPHR